MTAAEIAERDREEILRIADSLSRDELYGASQLICRLARERDEALTALEQSQAALAEAQSERDLARGLAAQAMREMDLLRARLEAAKRLCRMIAETEIWMPISAEAIDLARAAIAEMGGK